MKRDDLEEIDGCLESLEKEVEKLEDNHEKENKDSFKNSKQNMFELQSKIDEKLK